jgi:hypothetical protein
MTIPFLMSAEEEEREKGRYENTFSPEDKRYLNALREVIATEAGREFIAVLVGDKLGAFEPCWRGNSSIHKVAALRDAGQDLMDDIAIADGEAHDEITRKLRLRRKLFFPFDNAQDK